jgi:hypothetical protein
MQNAGEKIAIYLTSLFGYFFPLLSTLGGVVGLILNIASPTLPFPQPLSWVLIIVGLIWAGFIKDTKLRTQQRDLEVELAEYKKQTPEPIPQLKQKLVEGNEYSFALIPNRQLNDSRTELAEKVKQVTEIQKDLAARRDQERSQDATRRAEELRHEIEKLRVNIQELEIKDAIPEASLVLHLRLYNWGKIPVEILHINGLIMPHNTPWLFKILEAHDLSRCEIDFPIMIRERDILCCDLIGAINRDTYPLSNDILFATRLAPMSFDLPVYLKARVQVTVRWIDGTERRLDDVDYDIALRPLKEFYISKWQELNRQNLLKSALINEQYIKWGEGGIASN